MSATEKTFGVLKAVFVYQETIKAIREDMTALAMDVGALSRAHASLAERVARIEGMIEGAAMAGSLRPQPKLPRK